MVMTRSEMDTHLELNLGSRSGSSAFTPAQRNNFLNWALLDLASIRNWRSMKVQNEHSIKTVAGRSDYDLPNNFKTVLNLQFFSVASNETYPLTYTPPEIFDAQIFNKESSGGGYPEIYTWRGGHTIEVFPPPGTAGHQLHLFYAAWPEEFDLNNDEPCPLPRLERVIIALATGYGFESYRDFEVANRYRKNAFKILRRQARADGELSDWTPRYAREKIGASARRVGFDVPAL